LAGLGVYKKSQLEVPRPFKDNYIGEDRILFYYDITLMLFSFYLKYLVKRDDDPDAARFIRFHQNPKY
jgi:hypothetical protein